MNEREYRCFETKNLKAMERKGENVKAIPITGRESP
jgi:hypothetical protein